MICLSQIQKSYMNMSDSSNMEYESAKGSQMQRFKHAFSSPHASTRQLFFKAQRAFWLMKIYFPVALRDKLGRRGISLLTGTHFLIWSQELSLC